MKKIIDRENVEKKFDIYVSGFKGNDIKYKLKMEHTYKVATLCEKIAMSADLCPADLDLAWLLGMLHDIGRFEQLYKYATFQDAISIDHAELGGDMLFKRGLIRYFVLDDQEDELIEKVIRIHNKFEIPENFNEREKIFAKILRDADKIDILRVNVELPLENIYDVTDNELRTARISNCILEQILSHRLTLRDQMETVVDSIVGQIAFIYGLEFEISIETVKEQGFIFQLMDFQSENKQTQYDFQRIKESVETWLYKGIN